MAYKSVNPFNGQVLKTFEDLSDSLVELSLACAEQTDQERWSTKSFAEGAAVVRKAASILREKLNYFGRLITLAMGKFYA